MEEASLPVVRAAGPDIRLGWSVPKIRRNPLNRRVTRLPALVLAKYAQRILPGRAAGAVGGGGRDAPLWPRGPLSARLRGAGGRGRGGAFRSGGGRPPRG